MIHSAMLQAQIDLSRDARIHAEFDPAASLRLVPLQTAVHCDACNDQLMMHKELPSQKKVAAMGRSPFMDVSGLTSIIGLAAMNGSTEQAFIESSLWNNHILSVI